MAAILENHTLLGAQRGLLMRAIYGQVISIKLQDKGDDICQQAVQIIQDLSEHIVKDHDGCGLIVAFNPKLWGRWKGREIPISTKVLGNSNKKFALTWGDVLIYVKASRHKHADKILEPFMPRLKALSCEMDAVEVGKRPDARIMGGRYLDSITNPNDPISLTEDILIGGDARYRGSCFGFTQKFLFDWPGIASQTADSQDEMIGRNPDGAALPQHAVHSHVHRAHSRDSNGDQRKLLRQALPFGSAGKHAGRELGLMFVAFCNDQQRFEDILKHLIGDQIERPVDKLMTVVHGIAGSYWYVPSAAELGIASVSGPEHVYEDPHWQVASPNGYMFYNSQDYLHKMAGPDYVGRDPPSPRLLSLMARTFSHWRDSWMRRQAFPRLPHLETLIHHAAERDSIMRAPVPIRKGKANLFTLASLLSHPSNEIARVNGLLRIDAKELLVGLIPDFTLGRGKEVVPYLNKTVDQRLSQRMVGHGTCGARL
ncbi:hypothetical protein QBC37DRAFT_388937 [Rhypophila decipiens]|uniref:Dyp-type peroxidase C-terminal domain-containing protein n=1 Tax=Rhypophila decipiens TaxID=261697 RepID=A0AAN6Y5L3_9PEZI|nr:hypothetical protein QBC37DRAFT_388937 [Rhypophila decipiens]